MNYAGVTIDFYDDRGATVKAKFPTLDSLPEVIKTANVRPRDDLVNEDFALVAINKGHVMRKFACYDPGTTAMSVVYLMEHGAKLPPDAVKTAAANLVERCTEFDLAPPGTLVKEAGVKETTPSIVDITGQQPTPIIKEARPASDKDYCVVLPDGQRLYPIDSYDRVKMAEAYYLDNQKGMESVIRRQYAVKLAAKAELIGYPIDGDVKEAGALTWASTGHVKASLEMRKVACAETDKRALLDELFEKRADIGPDVFAEVLHQFDHQTGLSSLWDRAVLDPWSSTFGIQKTADEVIWEDGINRVTRGELENLVVNRLDLVRQQFSDQVAAGLKADTVAVFKSLPLPHKKILARLAADASADGDSEIDSEAPEAGEHKEAA